MTTVSTTLESTSRLAFTAADAAQRFGHPLVNMEHMLFALLLSQTAAGRQLRAASITLGSARQAVLAEHEQ